MEHLKKIYFLGIGGIGMSALARYFKLQGAEIHGYDRTETELTKALAAEGMAIHYDDSVEKIPENIDLVIWTPAIPKDHKELNWFIANKLPMKKRAEVLGLISRAKRCIAIGGTHGKTSTSTLTAHLMRASGVDSTAFVGGISLNMKSNFAPGTSDWVVVEADEYDRSFLHLTPEIAVINSIDADHLDIYGSAEKVLESYLAFCETVSPNGTLLIKYALKPLKKEAKKLAKEGRKVLTFGIEQGDIQAKKLRIENGFMVFDFEMPYLKLSDLKLQLPGRHNIENATVALAAALLAGADKKKIGKALAGFKGVKRRFEYIVKKPDFVFIDDYAHHPAELEATISAARMMYPDKKLTGIFQPHLFSRTRDFADDFAAALDKLDQIILLEIYPARELPMEGVSSEMLQKRMKNANCLVVEKQNLIKTLKTLPRPEVLLTMGAGDIDTFLKKIKNLNYAKPS